jgi:hypothetical protein
LKLLAIEGRRLRDEPLLLVPNAACVGSLIDRLIHNAEIVPLEGESYRLKEARERAESRAQKRRKTKR